MLVLKSISFQNATHPFSKYSFLNVLGTDECHHFQSSASEANFFPEEVWMRVESFVLSVSLRAKGRN
jgi:hypothetical protein